MVDEVPIAEFVGLGREQELQEWHLYLYLYYLNLTQITQAKYEQ